MKIKKNADVRHLGTLHTRWMHLIETGVLIRAPLDEREIFSRRETCIVAEQLLSVEIKRSHPGRHVEGKQSCQTYTITRSKLRGLLT